MKKREEKQKNIFLFFLYMVGIFILFDIVSRNLVVLFGRAVIYGKYMKDIIAETIFFIIVLFVVLIFKNQYIFSEKKKVKFIKGLTLAGPLLFLAMMNISFKKIANANIYDVLSLVVYSLLIGLAEEFMCRGWIQNEMIERFAKNRKQIILSIILSGLVFGVMHITNVFVGQGLVETIAQIIQAVGAGFILGAIYYRSKNIWLVVFLHAFWDFAILTRDLDLIKECTFLNPSFQASLFSLVLSLPLCLLYFACGLFLLRNSKVCGDFGETMTKDEINKEQSKYVLMFVIVFWIFIGVTNLMAPLQKSYEESQVCYEYIEMELENYSITKVYKDKYSMEYEIIEEIDEFEEEIEIYSFSTSLEHGMVVITNDMTNDSITINHFVTNYIVAKNDDKYLIGILVQEDEGSVLYYSDYITEENVSNDKSYLDNIKESFNRYVLPDSMSVLLLYKEDSNEPLIAVSNERGLTYIDDDEVYLVKQ